MFRKEKNETIQKPDEVEAEVSVEQVDMISAQQGLRTKKLEALDKANAVRRATIANRDEATAIRMAAQKPVDWEPEFDRVVAPCFLVDMNFNRSGDIIFKMRVPFRYRHLAMPLSEAYNTALEADIHKWSKAERERSRLDELYSNRQTASPSTHEPGSDGEATGWSVGDNQQPADDNIH